MSARKILRDVRAAVVGTTHFGCGPKATPTGVYPLDFDFTLDSEEEYYAPFDSKGIPTRRYESVGLQYNPTRIAAFALAHHARYIATGNRGSREKFLNAAGWFLQSEDGLWRYQFEWGGLRAPWISGMAQGQGVSVLVRAYSLTNDPVYLAQAQRAIVPFGLHIEEGGVRSKIDGHWDFLEEYPTARPAHTLNGYLFALVGIMDLAAHDPDASRRAGFDTLIATLTTQWRRWNLGFWSAYDLHVARGGVRNAATVNYHRIHICLTSYIARTLKSPQLDDCARVWEKQYHRRINRLRALSHKVVYRIAVPAQR